MTEVSVTEKAYAAGYDTALLVARHIIQYHQAFYQRAIFELSSAQASQCYHLLGEIKKNIESQINSEEEDWDELLPEKDREFICVSRPPL